MRARWSSPRGHTFSGIQGKLRLWKYQGKVGGNGVKNGVNVCVYCVCGVNDKSESLVPIKKKLV